MLLRYFTNNAANRNKPLLAICKIKHNILNLIDATIPQRWFGSGKGRAACADGATSPVLQLKSHSVLQSAAVVGIKV